MTWYMWLLLVCLVIGPFDALYLYIRSERRRETRKNRDDESKKPGKDGL